MSINETAMLVDLSVRQWSAAKHDKRVSREVANTHASDVNMGRFNKQLLSKGALEKVKQCVTKLRAEHYKRTLPWAEEGARILSSAGYMAYTDAMRKLEQEFEDAADEFAREYPSYVSDARLRLNGLFEASDYPATHAIRDRFVCGWNVMPMPSGDDFRVKLNDSERARIKADIERQVNATLDSAMHDVWTRIQDVVSHMAERLRAYSVTADGTTGAFRDTLVSNIRDLVELLPSLNITHDARITEFTERMRFELLGYSADTLRSSTRAREETARAAEAILDSMKEFV